MPLKSNLIFLYADSLKRDFSTCYILKNKLSENGLKSVICSRRNLGKFLRIFIPQKLFLIGQINIIPKKMIEYSKRGKSKIYFMPAEGIAEDSEYDLMYPKSEIYDFINSIYFWGQSPYTWFFKNRNLNDLEKIKKAGYTRYPIAETYKKTFGGDNKTRIGFIGRFPALNDLYNRNLLWFFLIENSNNDIEKISSRVKAETESIRIYLKIFNKIINETNFTISFRPHPNENIKTYELLISKYGKRVELNFDNDVSEWLIKCDKIVGLSSSSFIDAYITDTPVICIDKIIKIQDDTSVFDPFLKYMYLYSYNPENLEDLHKLLINKKLKPTLNNNFVKIVNNNLIGDTNIVFDKIYYDLKKESQKLKLWDSINIKILLFADLILSIYQWMFNRTSIQFDYSFIFHKPSKQLKVITKIINDKY